ncbi:DUF5666 domain-containing protein [Terriglobus saanensis]|uniref:DUF5666 domain-containing protein n=1 Tax=Terriglobus saanensis (strain ATCC BAA-1853 / DSM 23119 / SP1PR4) TaxID=401053 RepID=E8UY05_TERSS|nr:DUF5666 domain-containing protein [Terriglobus saanensis]ADV84239.1 hypothetical protein AciPR4_3485 [Terriglobus saanensis SP1PR4]
MRVLQHTFAVALIFSATSIVYAQAAPDASVAAARTSQRGTVKSITGTTLVIATDAGVQYTVSADAPAKVVVLAPGSTDLKTAEPGTLESISVGDRVLVSGKPGDANAIMALRVIVMRSADIAQRNAAQQADWQHRGSGGIVSAVDPGTGSITIKVGSRTLQLVTSPKTIYRRYAPGSVKFEEATASNLQQIMVGDQLRVRGDKSEDGTSITAEEIVSGAFRNVAGTIASIDAANSSLTVKDLATKKNVVVHLTPESDLRNLPAQMATMLAARNRGGAAGAGGQRPAGAPAAATPAPAEGAAAPGPGGPGAGRGMGAGRAGGGDLSQMIARLPATTLTELKPGAALMIVASQGAPSDPLTAVTVLSGVEPILAATPSGSQPMSLSPWNLGAGGAEAGGGGPQ